MATFSQSIRVFPLEPETELHQFFDQFIGAQGRVRLSRKGIQQNKFTQLNYLRDYVINKREFDTTDHGSSRSVLIEDHYIDRDWMEDFNSFYGRSLHAPHNACSRIHFFSFPADRLITSLSALRESFRPPHDQKMASALAVVDDFCTCFYLGFAIIRPLPGAPVGRTVLRALPETKVGDDNVLRLITNTHRYSVHLLGLDFTVVGLPFQQQDLCISACATVAIWCALHRSARLDDLRVLTPVDITRFATQYHLPLGRPVPSPGLDIDQMCIALQCAGISPYLTRVTSLVHGRAYLYAATISGLPSIMILERGLNEYHAVTVVGMKIAKNHSLCPIGTGPAAADDDSGSLRALYIHDDRIGPYRRADIDLDTTNEMRIRIPKVSHQKDGQVRKYETWKVIKLIIPLYPKIRISIGDLFQCAYDHVIPFVNSVLDEEKVPDVHNPIRVKYYISKGHEYLKSLNNVAAVSPSTQSDLLYRLPLSRYVGVISIFSPPSGQIDVLIDTTSARTDLRWLAVILWKTHHHILHKVAVELSRYLGCQLFGGEQLPEDSPIV